MEVSAMDVDYKEYDDSYFAVQDLMKIRSTYDALTGHTSRKIFGQPLEKPKPSSKVVSRPDNNEAPREWVPGYYGEKAHSSRRYSPPRKLSHPTGISSDDYYEDKFDSREIKMYLRRSPSHNAHDQSVRPSSTSRALPGNVSENVSRTTKLTKTKTRTDAEQTRSRDRSASPGIRRNQRSISPTQARDNEYPESSPASGRAHSNDARGRREALRRLSNIRSEEYKNLRNRLGVGLNLDNVNSRRDRSASRERQTPTRGNARSHSPGGRRQSRFLSDPNSIDLGQSSNLKSFYGSQEPNQDELRSSFRSRSADRPKRSLQPSSQQKSFYESIGFKGRLSTRSQSPVDQRMLLQDNARTMAEKIESDLMAFEQSTRERASSFSQTPRGVKTDIDLSAPLSRSSSPGLGVKKAGMPLNSQSGSGQKRITTNSPSSRVVTNNKVSPTISHVQGFSKRIANSGPPVSIVMINKDSSSASVSTLGLSPSQSVAERLELATLANDTESMFPLVDGNLLGQPSPVSGNVEAAEWARLIAWLRDKRLEKYADNFKRGGVRKLSVVELLQAEDLARLGIISEDIQIVLAHINEFSSRTRSFSQQAIDGEPMASQLTPRGRLRQSRSPSSEMPGEFIVKLLLQSFDNGDSQRFDEYWQEALVLIDSILERSAETLAAKAGNRPDYRQKFKQQSETKKKALHVLYFNVQLHFAVFPVVRRLASDRVQDAMVEFRRKLDLIHTLGQNPTTSRASTTKSTKHYGAPIDAQAASILAATNEFALYSGIVFAPAPQNIPSFAALFQPSWSRALREKLLILMKLLGLDENSLRYSRSPIVDLTETTRLSPTSSQQTPLKIESVSPSQRLEVRTRPSQFLDPEYASPVAEIGFGSTPNLQAHVQSPEVELSDAQSKVPVSGGQENESGRTKPYKFSSPVGKVSLQDVKSSPVVYSKVLPSPQLLATLSRMDLTTLSAGIKAQFSATQSKGVPEQVTTNHENYGELVDGQQPAFESDAAQHMQQSASSADTDLNLADSSSIAVGENQPSSATRLPELLQVPINENLSASQQSDCDASDTADLTQELLGCASLEEEIHLVATTPYDVELTPADCISEDGQPKAAYRRYSTIKSPRVFDIDAAADNDSIQPANATENSNDREHSAETGVLLGEPQAVLMVMPVAEETETKVTEEAERIESIFAAVQPQTSPETATAAPVEGDTFDKDLSEIVTSPSTEVLNNIDNKPHLVDGDDVKEPVIGASEKDAAKVDASPAAIEDVKLSKDVPSKPRHQLAVERRRAAAAAVNAPSTAAKSSKSPAPSSKSVASANVLLKQGPASPSTSGAVASSSSASPDHSLSSRAKAMAELTTRKSPMLKGVSTLDKLQSETPTTSSSGSSANTGKSKLLAAKARKAAALSASPSRTPSSPATPVVPINESAPAAIDSDNNEAGELENLGSGSVGSAVHRNSRIGPPKSQLQQQVDEYNKMVRRASLVGANGTSPAPKSFSTSEDRSSEPSADQEQTESEANIEPSGGSSNYAGSSKVLSRGSIIRSILPAESKSAVDDTSKPLQDGQPIDVNRIVEDTVPDVSEDSALLSAYLEIVDAEGRPIADAAE